jgi:hypothetical protein
LAVPSGFCRKTLKRSSLRIASAKQTGVDVLNAGLKGMSTNAAARELGYRLTSDSDAPLEKRWISIPQNVWHQPIISKEADWVVVSFHTVPAEGS